MERILKVLVGSRAHGLANKDSDWDYRGVFVAPTDDILKLNKSTPETNWVEEDEDYTSWELARFLKMATKSNPTILEMFKAPVEEATEEGEKLLDLFEYIWDAKRLRDAHLGYGKNQRKKFFKDKDGRDNKYLAAWARSLYNGYQILKYGDFEIEISKTEVGDDVRRFKEGNYDKANALAFCMKWEDKIKQAYKERGEKKTSWDKINEYLIKVRESNL